MKLAKWEIHFHFLHAIYRTIYHTASLTCYSLIYLSVLFVASTLQQPQEQTFVASSPVLKCGETELWADSILAWIHLSHRRMTAFLLETSDYSTLQRC